jgi:hypothetical protein
MQFEDVFDITALNERFRVLCSGVQETTFYLLFASLTMTGQGRSGLRRDSLSEDVRSRRRTARP